MFRQPAHPDPAFSPKTIVLTLSGATKPEPMTANDPQPSVQPSALPITPVPVIRTPSPARRVPQSHQVKKSAERETDDVIRASPGRKQTADIAKKEAKTEASGAQKEKAEPFEQWLASLQRSINDRKEYPYKARRRNLAGSVQVIIIVSPDGSLMDANIVSGKKTFHQSTLQAIQKAFPMSPTGKDEAVTIHLSVHYSLH